MQTQALALTRSKSPAGKAILPSSTSPPSANGNGLADNHNNCPASNLPFSHHHQSQHNNHSASHNNNTSLSHNTSGSRDGGAHQNNSINSNLNNCRDDRASMLTTSPKSTSSSNHSTRADFSGRESNGHGPSPSSIAAASPQNMSRDRSRSPPPAAMKSHPGNGASSSLALNIKEEENESSPNKDAVSAVLGPSNANLLAANYFASNHLKLAENLMSHGGANFLQANLLQASQKSHHSHNNNNNNIDIRTSPEKNNDDDGGSVTPLSTHHAHPMGGFERKDFDFSKVNGEWGSISIICTGKY